MEPYQIQSVLESLIITAGVVGGLFIVSRTWVKTRLSRAGGDVTQLTESVDQLRESVEGMREELGDIADRMDFTERVLSKVAEEQRRIPGT
jgi:outer membrane murein-binding lipoprotein Lpp